jgi:hypothetical protein
MGHVASTTSKILTSAFFMLVHYQTRKKVMAVVIIALRHPKRHDGVEWALKSQNRVLKRTFLACGIEFYIHDIVILYFQMTRSLSCCFSIVLE